MLATLKPIARAVPALALTVLAWNWYLLQSSFFVLLSVPYMNLRVLRVAASSAAFALTHAWLFAQHARLIASNFLIYYGDLYVHRNVPAGPRGGAVDVYTVPQGDALCPVVLFVPGGAWCWGATDKRFTFCLPQALRRHGVVTVVADYRKFPQGTVQEMVADVEAAVGWTLANVQRFGGDPEQVFLFAHSAGAQLASTVLLRQAALGSNTGSGTWRVDQVRAFIGLAGVYSLQGILAEYEARDIFAAVVKVIIGGERRHRLYSAVSVLGQLPSPRAGLEKSASLTDVADAGAGLAPVSSLPDVAALSRAGSDEAAEARQPALPHFTLIHGDQDSIVSHDMSMHFWKELQRAGVEADHIEYKGQDHLKPLFDLELSEMRRSQDPIVRMGGSPLRRGAAGEAVLLRDILRIMRGDGHAHGAAADRVVRRGLSFSGPEG